MNKNNKFSLEFDFEVSGNKKYELKAIQNSMVYINKVGGQLLVLYYLVS